MKTTTTAGILKDALKKALSAANADTATITVGEVSFVEVSGHEGYCKVTFQPETKGAAGSASIPSSVVNAVLGGVERGAAVSIEPVKDGLVIRFGGARFKLKTDDNAGLFDNTKLELAKKPLFEATGAELAATFKAATAFAAKKDIRYYLCGVHVAEKAGKLVATATNGFCLHNLTTTIPVALGQLGAGLIIPGRAAEALLSVFEKDEAVSVSLMGEGLLQFSTDNMCWVNNLVTGRFPNCDALIANEHVADFMVEANTRELVQALQRVQAISGDRYCHVKIDAENVKVESIDLEQVCTMSVVHHGGTGEVEFGVTTALLLEALEAVPSEKVLLATTVSSKSNIYLRPISGQGEIDGNWIGLVTPANV